LKRRSPEAISDRHDDEGEDDQRLDEGETEDQPLSWIRL
jgi:hypothetical protein